MGEHVFFLGIIDYVVISVILLISAGVGVYYHFTGGRQKSVTEYLLANRNMHVVPVAFSLMASLLSAVAILGAASESYTYGIQQAVFNFAIFLFAPVLSYIYMPVFFRLQVTSVYEYLGKRFGMVARLAGSLTRTILMTMQSGLALYAPALALDAVTGIPKSAAILSLGLVCTFYSTIGGMKAVIVTDAFQSLLMFAAVTCVPIHAILQTGSFSEIWRIAKEGNRTSFLNFDIDPTVRHSWFSLIIGGGVIYLSVNVTDQSQIQRYLCVKDLKSARQALYLKIIMSGCLNVSAMFTGLVIYAKYYQCDPVANRSIRFSDQLLPYYVVQIMGHIPGLSGLFISGLFSAALSTLSSSLNCLAAVTLEDYLKPIYFKAAGRNPPNDKLFLYSKIISLVFGFICIGLAFFAHLLGGLLQSSLTLTGILGGPLLALFSLGMFTRSANQKGAMTGFVAGIVLCCWAAFGGPRPALPKLPVQVSGCNGTISLHPTSPATLDDQEYFWLYRMSYLYNGVIGFLCAFVVGISVSTICNKVSGKTPKVDPNLLATLTFNTMIKVKNDETEVGEALLHQDIRNGHEVKDSF
ncbi:putative sodium-dependent multivitamin transporter [Photinus pyralis]|uniref:putative sodium-dependent multivitamin transporter n=1 Tax=Photinus pyralis TaxID=7054 RepID=UPI0012677428|nr:putative sodium-dependent multivitamin transporter [Photinus pyralis]